MPVTLCRPILFFMLLLVAFNSTAQTETATEINVYVSILPQKYFVERIAGERVNVQVMVKAGMNPETYEPTPKQMASMENADLYFRIAVPFENIWIDQIRDLNPGLQIVECCGELEIVDPPPYDPSRQQLAEPGGDTHVWTSPANVKILAAIIKDTLIKTDPGHADFYLANFNDLIAELDDLDQFIHQQLATMDNRYLLVAHPSWGHFAIRYDLIQVAIERHGAEARARELSQLIEFAREQHIDRIYTQKQFHSSAARMLAREIDAEIVELDPLAENYVDNLRNVAITISKPGDTL